MNNKGFAITTILFGLLILFIMLIFSLLGILSMYRENLKMLIEKDSGSREIITIKPTEYASYTALINSNVEKSGLYCFRDTGQCKYVSRRVLTTN